MIAVPSSAVTAVYVIGQIAMIAGKDILTRAHGALVFGRRVRILAANLAKEIRCWMSAQATARLPESAKHQN